MFPVTFPQLRLIFFKEIFQTLIQKTFLDYFSIDWNVYLKLDEKNVDYLTESFFNKIHSLHQVIMSLLKKISKYKLKFCLKPWIATGLQKSVSVKNKFLTNFIKEKDPTKKAELHLQYKNHITLLSTLLKEVNKIIL